MTVTSAATAGGFNEAEAIKPRNLDVLWLTSANLNASMRPRQSSLGIRQGG